MFQDYYKPLHYLNLIIYLIAYLNWVVLDSPWGTFFWLRTKIACPSAPPQPQLIVYSHLQILLFARTITNNFVRYHMRFFFLLLITLIFVQLNVILILRHIYIKKNWRSKPKLNNNAIKSYNQNLNLNYHQNLHLNLNNSNNSSKSRPNNSIKLL